jgi:hypothetical protein
MDNTTHFIGVTGEALSRLAALIEQAANVLDTRGGRRLRSRIIRETHLALCALRAADSSTLGPAGDFLAREINRIGALHGARQLEPASQRIQPRSHLRIVGGTDMEGSAA